ncbi:hypothetical protein TUM4445_25820 [Shewanella sp. MBTL60-112-B2]|nr:hypothetical protein TUM4444_06580 [Shewanella sp. MBTL60-112-B1]GIU35687.1 hypothetical protein TUM4445_25820 [Shewanella sp. MBTL60-112-B2]
MAHISRIKVIATAKPNLYVSKITHPPRMQISLKISLVEHFLIRELKPVVIKGQSQRWYLY